MKSKIERIAAWILSGLAGLMIIASGVMKLTGAQAVVDGLSKIGVGPYISMLGAMEVVFAALFLYPKTSKIGFLLTSSYFAGALATDLSHGNSVASPVVILVMVWIGAFLRKPEIFLDRKIAV